MKGGVHPFPFAALFFPDESKEPIYCSAESRQCVVAPITKHGNFTESRKSRKTKNRHKILVFLRFISYFSIVWNILKDILVFS